MSTMHYIAFRIAALNNNCFVPYTTGAFRLKRVVAKELRSLTCKTYLIQTK